MAITILPTSSFHPTPISFIQSYICSFSLSILHSTLSYYIIILLGHFCYAAVAIKTNDLLICFCSFDLSGPILEIKKLILYNFLYCIVLSY